MWKKYFNIFLLLYIPLLVISLLMLMGHKEERIATIKKREDSISRNKTYLLSDVCHYLIHNTNYWSSIVYPPSFDPKNKHSSFLHPYIEVIKNIGFYDQFRIIDLEGKELLRYQSNLGQKMELAPLQNKVDSEYVKQGLNLKKGEIYLSRINLNREDGIIEKPHKPVLRTVGPIYDSLNQRTGLIVINFRMQDVLGILTSTRPDGNTYVIDSEHNIIASSIGDKTMMFEVNKSGDTLDSNLKKLNERGLRSRKDTTFFEDGRVWSLHKVLMTNGELNKSAAYLAPKKIIQATEWAVVREMPPEAISAGLWPLYQNFIVLHLFSILALSGISYGFNKYQSKKRDLFNRIEEKNKALLINQESLKTINDVVKKTNQRLRVKNEQLEQFSYLISHNLRAPVTSMSLIIDVIKKEENEENIKTLLPKLHILSDSIGRLTEDIKEYVTAVDYEDTELQEINVYALIQGLRGDFPELMTGLSNFKIVYELQEWKTVNSSKYHLQSVIRHLISNAIKYRNTEIESYLVFRSEVENNRKILYVEDNGLGINMERYGDDLFKLYKKFHRNISGKGMGLFMVKTQLEEVGATISAKSIEGKGTKFKINF
ncbi:sensor histidine kinase [Pseudozobellia sp. WGM2]|uniref:sensor histidine kinase n=1 Tax=Pseudozobellia sp. WGM2 TaxID=2787625 RepID=UPI001ADEE9CF|nr:sensor histidine kinase [Pseudozobellia sp. WGM2]